MGDMKTAFVSEKWAAVAASSSLAETLNELSAKNSENGEPLKLFLAVNGGYIIGTPVFGESTEDVIVQIRDTNAFKPNLAGITKFREDIIDSLKKDGPVEIVRDGTYILMRNVEAFFGTQKLSLAEMIVFCDQICGLAIAKPE